MYTFSQNVNDNFIPIIELCKFAKKKYLNAAKRN
jgi:hypothetical protein